MRAVAGMISVALCASVLSGCGTSAGEKEEGALAAARAYVDAIADRDPATADAMTDAEALAGAFGRGDADTDIRASLVDAVDPIADPWLTLASGTPEDGVRSYWVDVSYTIAEATGGQSIMVQLEDGGDPSEVDDWQVTVPLIAGADTYVPAGSRIGPVELPTSDGMASIKGYPGGYRAEVAGPDQDDRTRSVVLGAQVSVTWAQRLAGPAG